MLIVAVAWIYVVGLMALTESSVVAGVMTFLAYCALPLSIVYYITGYKRRRSNNFARDRARAEPTRTAGDDAQPADPPSTSDDPPRSGGHSDGH